MSCTALVTLTTEIIRTVKSDGQITQIVQRTVLESQTGNMNGEMAARVNEIHRRYCCHMKVDSKTESCDYRSV